MAVTLNDLQRERQRLALLQSEYEALARLHQIIGARQIIDKLIETWGEEKPPAGGPPPEGV